MIALREAQIAFAVAEMSADIGDEDIEAQDPYYYAMQVLAETHPADLPEAAARLQFLLCVSERYADCSLVREAMLMVAAWLALAATAKTNVDNIHSRLEAA